MIPRVDPNRSVFRFDWHLILLLLAGMIVFVVKCRITHEIEYVGHADASAYAEMADSILHGRGLTVDYVSFHFLRYDPGISRPEDHWPPLYSFFILPFFLFWGKTAFAAKLPSLIISSLLFPIVCYSLAKRLSGSRTAGLAAGLNLLIYPVFFRHSLYSLSDITYAFMIGLTVLMAIRAIELPKYYLPMGISLGLAYYAKGSALVMIPGYFLFHLIIRRSQPRVASRDRRFAFGMFLCFLTMLPWFIRNIVHFGDPFFSTQRFCAGYIGYIDWEKGTYPLYWGENLPTFSDKLKDGITPFLGNSWRFFKQYLWWVFIDLRRGTGDFKPGEYHTYFAGIPAVFHLAMMALAATYRFQASITGEMIRWGRKRKPAVYRRAETFIRVFRGVHRWVWRLLRGWYDRRLLLIALVSALLLGFLSMFWSPIDRMAFPVSGLMIAVGWSAYHVFFRNLLRSRFVASMLILPLIIVLSWHSLERIRNDYENGGYPYHDGSQAWIEVGRWIRANLPGSVTMTRNPWELHFYSEEKAVQIPLAPLEDVIKVARYYGVTHLIPDERRPALNPWLTGEVPGLELIYDRGLKLYRIDYERIPDHLMSNSF